MLSGAKTLIHSAQDLGHLLPPALPSAQFEDRRCGRMLTTSRPPDIKEAGAVGTILARKGRRAPGPRQGFGLLAVLVVAIAVSVSAETSAEPFFMGIGDLPGGLFQSRAHGVSADGSVVVGEGLATPIDPLPFRWSAADGMVRLGTLTGNSPIGLATGVSADGSVVVGGYGANFDLGAFRWTATGGMVGLDALTGGPVGSVAFGVSADGSVVVGLSGNEPFRWTAAGGMVGLGTLTGNANLSGNLSAALGVSADGSVVVGYSGNEPFRWTAASGMVGLGGLTGAPFGSIAKDVSADGSVVVGHSGSEAFRWTAADGMVSLGGLTGNALGGSANAVSADGSVVVGYTYSSFSTSDSSAFVWDATTGMRALREVLSADHGLDLTGWALTEATGISANGKVIVGTGVNPDGNTEAWIAGLGNASPPLPTPPLPAFVNDPALRPAISLKTEEILQKPEGLHLLNGAVADPTKPSIIITHGWQPGGNWSAVQQDEISAGDLSDQPLRVIKEAVLARLAADGIEANVFAYNWRDAFTPNPVKSLGFAGDILGMFSPGIEGCIGLEACGAYVMVAAHGSNLAFQLSHALEKGGREYMSDIHFVGHSFGSLVNAHAINFLNNSGALKVTQATILDAPLFLTGANASDFHALMPRGSVSYVDNFYGLIVDGGVGGPIRGAAPTAPAPNPPGGMRLPLGHVQIPNYYADLAGSGSDDWTTPLRLLDFYGDRPAPQFWDPRNKLEKIWEASVDTIQHAKDVIAPKIGELLSHTSNVTKSTFAQIDPSSQIAAAWFQETSPSVASMKVDIPIGADYFSFDIGFLDRGDGDWFTLLFDDILLLSLDLRSFETDTVHTQIVALNGLDGRMGTLWFVLNSVGDANAQLLIGNFRFLANTSVSEPGASTILVVGAMVVALLRRREKAKRSRGDAVELQPAGI